MTRLQGVSPKGKPVIGITYRIARRELRRMTGKPLLTPDIPVRAHNLRLLTELCEIREGSRLRDAGARRPACPGGAQVGGHAGL